MASMSPPITPNPKSLASDHLRSSTASLTGVPLRDLGRSRLPFATKRRDLCVLAKLRKLKKHEYPWPEDPDPNVKGGVLTLLSGFKPLKEKPNLVTLDFEKPLINLQKKIIDVRNTADETGLDFSDQISSLETKYQQALKELYLHLTPMQRLNIARHPNRPTFLDHMFNITEKFVELHGDRAGYDDPAVVTGLGTINGRSYLFIGQQKGRNTKENIARNFGMPTPHGYRKALRMMYYADHHGFPIVTFIDTPGAYADLKSEEIGQGEAIAHNLRTMFGLKVPIITIVIGEGGSGGALAIGCANKLLMLENAVLYVASPEACAAILWKTAKASPKAAEKLKITATESCRLQIADGVIPEPLGGAHADPAWTSQQIKKAIVESMDELVQMDTQELLSHRNMKFRKIGGFQEEIPIDPKRKVNMKKKEEPLSSVTLTQELESKVGKLREQILKAKDLSTKTPDLDLDEMIEKLQAEVDVELSEAAKALGLKDRLLVLQQDHAKARSSQDELIHPALLDKAERFKDEFSQRLPSAPNYPSLRYKLDMLEELSKAKKLSDINGNSAILKKEIDKKFKDVLDRPDIKEKVEMLKFEIEKSGASTPNDLNSGVMEKIMEVKGKIESKFASVLKSLDWDLEDTIPPSVKGMFGESDEEIQKRIEDAVNSSDLKNKIELLKSEAAKAEMNADPESQKKVRVLVREIKQNLAQALSSSVLDNHKKMNAELGRVVESNGAPSRTPTPSGDVNSRVPI